MSTDPVMDQGLLGKRLEKLIEEYRSFTGAVDQILDQENSNTIRIGECS